MAKITKDESRSHQTRTIQAKTQNKSTAEKAFSWWKAQSQRELASQVMDTVAYLKEMQQYRFRQAAIQARMYGNLPLSNYSGSALNKMTVPNMLPVDRPTMNVIQSCIDTLVSRISQARPRPVFLTDAADYKQRSLAKELNQFITGEFHQTKAYELARDMMRDAAILGDGCLKIYETDDKRVGLERVLCTELLVDQNDAYYAKPRSMYQIKLIDRAVLLELFPEYKARVEGAEQAYPDSSGDSQKSLADQVIVAEAWHLRSGKSAKDGRHVICCTGGVLLDEEFCKDDFPFIFLPYSRRMVGFWSQGLAEQLTGTQVEINKLLVTISQSISLVGVPRVFVEDGSKVVKAHLNDKIGAIVTYRGTKPQYEVAPCVPAELYQQLQRLIDYAYQQSGISALAATSQKPSGLNSGEAIRSYDDLQSDRFASFNQKYDNMFIELAYKMVDLAKDIAERDGEYQTIYPGKDGTKRIDLPAAKLLDDPFIIQCYDSSSLPKDPAGRRQRIVEDMQAGILSLDEGRRLLDYPDLEQVEKLKNAPEERILQMLDDIVNSGKYTPPDPFVNIEKGKELVAQYYNLYVAAGLEESKAEMLRNWQSQLLELEQAAMPPMPMPGAPMPNAPIAVPEAPPTSNLLPIRPQ